MKTTEQLATLGVIFAVIIVGFVLFFRFSPGVNGTVPAALDTSALVRPDSAMTGTTTAKVTLVEWGDFECPSCAMLEPVLRQIISTYGANPEFNFVFRNFPLPQHKHSRLAAEAAEAAGAQGHYWDMHALLYEHQKEWTESADPRAAFEAYAKAIKLDPATFTAALDSHAYASKVARDYQDAGAIRLNHTPTVFINGVELRNMTFADISKAIDDALAQ